MATTKDYSDVPGPCATRYFAGGDAANWCVVTPPLWCRAITITNRGTGAMYVAVNGLNTIAGAANATTTYSKIVAAGAAVTLQMVGTKWGQKALKLSVWGADGAAHAMDFLFDAGE